MATPRLRRPSKEVLIVLGLFVVAAVFQGPTTVLPLAAALVFGALRLRAPLRGLMSAERLSWKSSLALIAAFAVALVAGGHGVAPVALFLVYGWEHFAVPVALAWLAILALGSSPWIGVGGHRHGFAPALSLLGSILALVAWILFEAVSDEPLAGVLGSLPFLICFAVHSIHLWRIRAPARAASGSA